MIAYLKGIVFESAPLMVVLEVSGVGYEVHVPLTTAEKIPAPGNECCLHIHSVYREDSASLYGFSSLEERDFFRLIIEKVSGIGPRIAIAILSRMSVERIRSSIANADITALSKCQGIGKKTAERMVIELKDKVGLDASDAAGFASQSGGVSGTGSETLQDAVASLMVLGYKQADADKLIRKAASQLPGDVSVERLIKQALA